MTLGRFSLNTVVLLSSVAAAMAGPTTHVLDTTSYNYQLDGGGGGALATLDKSQSIEIFCVDYANDIYVPQQNYSAYLTTITGGSDLSVTRFGNVSSWTAVNITGDSTDSSTINNSTDLGRYQMAAYLVSQYDSSTGKTGTFSLGGGTTNNDGIQQAIWDILDPKGETFGQISTISDTNAAIEAAAKWYTGMGGNGGSSALNTLLANFRIVSDSTMGSCSGSKLVNCGFQEQITEVPEPRHVALMLMGLLLVGSVTFRKLQAARRSDS
jgi:hypothetical protein